MLEQVQRLPSAERELASSDGNQLTRLGERGFDVRGHVVWAFIVMLVGFMIG